MVCSKYDIPLERALYWVRLFDEACTEEYPLWYRKNSEMFFVSSIGMYQSNWYVQGYLGMYQDILQCTNNPQDTRSISDILNLYIDG
jgi:hypothetical protein